MVPRGLAAQDFVLEALGPEHNERDFAAWTSSVAHIHATPGFADRSWPHPMTLQENLADLEGHARDFVNRTGFTYTVLDPVARDVIGCVYIYPADDAVHDADVRSWVRASHASLDVALWLTVSAWLAAVWPFTAVAYGPRGETASTP